MKPADRAVLARIVRRTTMESNVPEQLEDPATIVRIGRLLRRGD